MKSGEFLSVTVLMYCVSSAFKGALSVHRDKASAFCSAAVEAATVSAAEEAFAAALLLFLAPTPKKYRQETVTSAAASTPEMIFQITVGFFLFSVMF